MRNEYQKVAKIIKYVIKITFAEEETAFNILCLFRQILQIIRELISHRDEKIFSCTPKNKKSVNS